MISLRTNFQCKVMLVDGCNFAQLTAWAYRAMYFSCAALQAVQYFLKHENLLHSYTKNFSTLIIKLYLNTLKIYYSTLLPSVDIVCFG